MNTGCTVPPEPWDIIGKIKPVGDISTYTEEQAMRVTIWYIKSWQEQCRHRAGICAHHVFTPWHKEADFVREAMLEADTNNLVRSIVEGFNRKCRDYRPA